MAILSTSPAAAFDNVTLATGATSVTSSNAVTLALSPVGQKTTYNLKLNGSFDASFNIQYLTSAFYTTPLQALTNNGNQFRALVSVPGRTITSSAALLTVVNDTNKPHVTTVVSGNTLPIVSVRVSFDELMDGTMLGNLAKYTLTGSNNASVALSAPVVAANNLSVTFTTPALTLGAYYTLHAQDVPDAAGNPLAATNIVFQAGRGTVVMETYDTSSTPGTAVALLTAHPNYPNSPRETFLLPTWSSAQ